MNEPSQDLFVEDDTASEGSEHLQVTPEEVVKLLKEAWINEKFAPEILPHKSEIVDIILEQIKTMEENIKKLSSTDFTKSIYQLEVDRLRFLVSSYLRIRLEKIESYINFILDEEAKRNERKEDSYLSTQELDFAKNFSFTMDQYFDKLMRFYPGIPSETWSNTIIEPNNDSFVFFKSKIKVEDVAMEESKTDSDVLNFDVGSQRIILYSSISRLLKKGDINLI